MEKGLAFETMKAWQAAEDVLHINVYGKVHLERLELPTFCSEDKRSIQLSYRCRYIVIIADFIPGNKRST